MPLPDGRKNGPKIIRIGIKHENKTHHRIYIEFAYHLHNRVSAYTESDEVGSR